MSSTGIRLASLVLLTTLACSAGHGSSEQTASSAQAITGGLGAPATPVGWNGSKAELIAADAIARCSAVPTTSKLPADGWMTLDAYSDVFLQREYSQMESAANTSVQINPVEDRFSIISDWVRYRGLQNPPVKIVGVPAPPQSIPKTTSTNPIDVQAWRHANGDLRTATVNLCIAQLLRDAMPGTGADSTLFLSEPEQRELLEITHERVQIAMMQYALLGELFASDQNPQGNGRPSSQVRLDFLMDWASTHDLGSMGGDFATAVQMHVIVGEELASLYARSRSKRSPYAAEASSASARYWGAASWHQRNMVLLFGGDPLAQVIGGPWNLFTSLVPGTLSQIDWPGPEKAPHFTTEILEPQVTELLRLAKRFDQVNMLPAQPAACQPFDVQKIATRLYNWTEASIRQIDCDIVPPATSCPTRADIPQLRRNTTYDPANNAKLSDYFLWQKYRITPDHALTLALYLNDALGLRVADANRCNVDVNDSFKGAFDVASPSGVDALTVVPDGTGGDMLHMASEAQLVQRDLLELEPTFTRNAVFSYVSPDLIASAPFNMDAGGFGFNGLCIVQRFGGQFFTDCNPGYGVAAEAKRTLGVLPSLAAVRDVMVQTRVYLQTHARPSVEPYLKHEKEIVAAIDGAVGKNSLSIAPIVELGSAGGVVGASTTSIVRPVRSTGPSGGSPMPGAQFEFAVAPKDTFWNPCLGSTPCALYAIQGDYAADLAGHSQTTIRGKTLRQLLDAAKLPGATGGYTTQYAAKNIGSDLRLLTFKMNQLPAGTYTLVVQVGTDAAKDTKYFPAGAHVVIDPTNARWGQHLATDGVLGTWIGRQSLPNISNPVEPMFDGFDLRLHWVPPFSAALLGGSADQTSLQYFLGVATGAADDAAKAVQTAVDGIIQQETDAATLQAAVAKSQQAIQQASEALCGQGNPKCSSDTTTRNIDLAWYQLNPPMPNDCDISQLPQNTPLSVDQAKCVLKHLVNVEAQSLTAMQVDVSDAVYKHIGESSAPAFEEYAGGDLQAAFIEQWRSLKAPQEKLQALINAEGAAEAQIDTAQAVLQALQDDIRYSCSDGAYALSLVEGINISGAVAGAVAGITTGPVGSVGGALMGAFGGGFSPNAYIEQRHKCDMMEHQLAPDQKRVLQAQADAYAAISAASVGFFDIQAAIQQGGAKIHSLANQARMAVARAELEAKLAATLQVTSFGIYRRYHDADLWRAKALFENARRYALAARRALEARYVVDLSKLSTNESFVASPSTWADEVYGYDLNLPAAVGLTVPDDSKKDANGIYANQVKDYVTNLQGFLSGYAVTRPAAVASDEIDVVTLAGLAPGSGTSVATQPPSQVFTDLGEWSLHCPGDSNNAQGQWIPLPRSTTGQSVNIDTPCIANGVNVKPDRARLEFSLDPWARLNGAVANEPFQKRFNTRWGQLAVNFVGTGVKDCTKAADPNGCYAQGFIPFNLTHAGPAWVTDYDEVWRFSDVPSGQIEGGKALAAEIWLDPLRDGWSTSYIAPVARTELLLRPVGGAYALEFLVGPEIVLHRIERVQLLVGSSSWVKQQ